VALVDETNVRAGDVEDGCRNAHNPEVAGSNPAPATNFAGQRPLPIMEGAFLLWRANELANGPFGQVASCSSRHGPGLLTHGGRLFSRFGIKAGRPPHSRRPRRGSGRRGCSGAFLRQAEWQRPAEPVASAKATL
jgi:hypothetical protein